MATNSNWTQIQKNIIINNGNISTDLKEKLIVYSIIEALYNMIDYYEFYKKNNKEKKDMNLDDMAKYLYNSRILNSDGLLGVCFERFVYDCIVNKYEDLCSELRNFLYKLDKVEFSEEIDVMLWGDEKGDWIKDENLNITLNNCLHNDTILIGEIYCKMKDVLKQISYNNSCFNNIGKADLFIKQKGYNIWHGVNVKLKYEDLKMNSKKYSSLDIGIALTTDKINIIKNNQFNEEKFWRKNNNIYVFQKDYDYAFFFNSYLGCFKELLKEISCGENKRNTSSVLGRLPKILQDLYINKNISIIYLEYLLETDLMNNSIYIPKTEAIANNQNIFLFNDKCQLIMNLNGEQNSANKIMTGTILK